MTSKGANSPKRSTHDTPLGPVPVLFLVFNRPETTAKSFQAIANARPERLYVAADGPRQNKKGESLRCEEVRQIAATVDWPCEVKTLFREHNLGCKKAVSSAIDWFFEQEPEGIILEDDCLASPDFFIFARQLLTRYRDDARIMCISAQHFHGDAHQPDYSYFFSRYNHCWGWASWASAWQYYDRDMKQWPTLRDTDWLMSLGNGSRLFSKYWTYIFDRTHAGEIDTWDYQWTFSCWAKNGLCILPAKNLVTNIGFDDNATHTTNHVSGHADLPLESLNFPLLHPDEIERDIAADRWTESNHYKINLKNYLKRSARQLLSGD